MLKHQSSTLTVMYESKSDKLFKEAQSFYHVCTKPIENGVLFEDETSMDMALNAMAITVFCTECRLLAFAVMSNHFHFIMEGSLPNCRLFFETFRRQMCKQLARSRSKELFRECEANYVPINSLTQLRDEIAYVVRNPFVARNNVNMFAYKWCSGYLYFNGLSSLFREGASATTMRYTQRRNFLRSRIADIDPRIMVVDSVALPSCFVDYKRTESFFESARDFQHCLLKNVESQVKIANRLGEDIRLDDHDLWGIVRSVCKNTYRVDSPRQLSISDKVELSKILKYQYRASNSQIARCSGMTVRDVDELFPLSAKEKRP